MNRVKRKLKSRRGASIIIALLLFLVCAVIGSILIVSATSSAGRFAEMAKMDRRYYCVTSAARLIRDMYDGMKVQVEVENKKIKSIKTILSDKTEKTITDKTDFLVADALKLLKKEQIIGDSEVDNLKTPAYQITVEKKENGIKTEDINNLNAEIIIDKGSSDRSVIIEVSSGKTNQEKNEEIYKMRITCKADILRQKLKSGTDSVDVYTVTWSTYDRIG